MSDGFQVFETIDGDYSAGIVLLCDHASNALPEEYGSLGLPPAEFERHIAYDIGAADLTRALAEKLGVPAVMSCFSRLLVDPNRGADDPTVVMRLSDGTVVPGNHPLCEKEKSRRIDGFHAPYHAAISRTIDEAMATGVAPLIFSIHSFTPAWKGVPRPWHAAILWDADPRLPHFLIDAMRREPGMMIGDNEPYDGALRNDTMYVHATSRGLSQALLEVRNDLIAEPAGVAEWADRLALLLAEANKLPEMHEVKAHGSRTDARAMTGDSV